jgi:tetratricopeptide (TPR) repeat protein
MKKYLIFMSMAVFFAAAACADSSTTSAWLLINSYPDVAAKGSATGAACYGITAASVNPAALAGIENLEFAVMHNQWLQGVTGERLSAGRAFDFGNIGIDLAYNDLGTIAVLAADQSGNPVITGDLASMRAWSASLIYGKKIKNFSLGLAARMLSENLGSGDYYTGCADAGMIYEGFLNEKVNLGISLLNISAESSGYYTPINLKASIIYKYEHGGSPVINLSAACDYLLKDSYMSGQAGFDYYLFDTVILRGGISVSQPGSVNFSAGAGVKVEGLNINYSYEPVSELGAAHKIALSAAFGKSAQAGEGESEGENITDKGTFLNYMESGDFFYNSKEYRKAIKYYEYINTLYWKDIEDKQDKDKSSFFQKLGICYYNIRDNKRALQYFERAVYYDKENEILKHWIKSLK